MLPDYEEALAQSLKQPPPPYYQEAILSSPMANANVAAAAASTSHTINGGRNEMPPMATRLPTNIVTHVAFVDKHTNQPINHQS